MEVMETEGKETGHQDVYESLERHQDGVPRCDSMPVRQQADAHKTEQEMRNTYESLGRYVCHTLTDVVGLETIHGIPLIESDCAQSALLVYCLWLFIGLNTNISFPLRAFMAHLEAHSGHCEVIAQDTLPR